MSVPAGQAAGRARDGLVVEIAGKEAKPSGARACARGARVCVWAGAGAWPGQCPAARGESRSHQLNSPALDHQGGQPEAPGGEQRGRQEADWEAKSLAQHPGSWRNMGRVGSTYQKVYQAWLAIFSEPCLSAKSQIMARV